MHLLRPLPLYDGTQEFFLNPVMSWRLGVEAMGGEGGGRRGESRGWRGEEAMPRTALEKSC